MARFSLVVTSDRVYRGEAEDRVTPLVENVLKGSGHILSFSVVVPNTPHVIRSAVVKAVSYGDIVLVTGGTGLSPRDVSVDVVEMIADRRVPGFGEEHRRRSLERVGGAALISRVSAYMVGPKLVLVTPGSPDAVNVALDIILDIIDHVVEQARGGRRHPHKCPSRPREGKH